VAAGEGLEGLVDLVGAEAGACYAAELRVIVLTQIELADTRNGSAGRSH
jgi:hypothetical protein